MFKRSVSPRFSNTVTVPVLTEKGEEVNTFKAIFSRADTEELKDLRKLATDEELVRRKLVDWELVDADTKESLPFTPENLDSILLIAPTPRAIAVAFWEGVNGARAKN